MVYLIAASIKCAFEAGKQGGAANSVMLFSVLITYGCEYFLSYFVYLLTFPSIVYAISSLLAFDPWHMFTSFVPYLLLSPMYINILNMLV